MSTLSPPVALQNPENQFRVDYIQDVASQHDFDYPAVSIVSCLLGNCELLNEALFFFGRRKFVIVSWKMSVNLVTGSWARYVEKVLRSTA